MGASVRHSRARRLFASFRDAAALLMHHAPVTPARNKDKKVIPAHAVDEWPDGKERRPSSTSAAFLQYAA